MPIPTGLSARDWTHAMNQPSALRTSSTFALRAFFASIIVTLLAITAVFSAGSPALAAAPGAADLGVSMTISDPVPSKGQTVTHFVTLTNHGPDTATGVTATVALPKNYTLQSATPSVGSYSADTGIWAIGTVLPGVPLTLIVNSVVDTVERRTVTAKITSSDLVDPNTSNNEFSVVSGLPTADLALTATPQTVNAIVGKPVSFNVRLTNRGPDAATNVLVDTVLPAGVQIASMSTTKGSLNAATMGWSLDALPAGAIETLTLTMRPTQVSNFSIVFSITESDQLDPDGSNNQAVAHLDAKTTRPLTATIDPSPHVYTGSPIHPEPSVIDADSGAPLRLHDDYTLEYGPNTTVAQGGTVKIVGKDSYDGSSQTFSFSIVPAAVTVTADNQSMEFGSVTPNLTWTATPQLANVDTLTGTLETVSNGDVGTHVIQQAAGQALSNPNYAVHFVPGTMTISFNAAQRNALHLIRSLPQPVATQAEADAVAAATNAYDALSAAEISQLPATTEVLLRDAQQSAGTINHSSGSVTISGITLPWSVRVTATEISQSDKPWDAFTGGLPKGRELLSLFDITLVDTLTGAQWQPAGPLDVVTVSIAQVPLAGKTGFGVLHEGDQQEFSATVSSDGTTVSFQATSFSLYGITVDAKQTTTEPEDSKDPEGTKTPEPKAPKVKPTDKNQGLATTGTANPLLAGTVAGVMLLGGLALTVARARRRS